MYMEKFCFSTFVFGRYQKFIPFYVYSIVKTYPNADIKIFTDMPIEGQVNKSLEIIKCKGFSNFEIILLREEHSFFLNGLNIVGGEKKLIRWLIGLEYFSSYEYVYFGDVDIFYLKENTSLFETHLNQMKRLGLPFSNKVRLLSNGSYAKRLTGLHCVKVAPYFEKIQPIITLFYNDIEFRQNLLKDVSRDEHLLYNFCKYAFNFDDECLIKSIRPWHGIHLGITRGNKKLNQQQIIENSSLSLDELKLELIALVQDDMFKQIQNELFLEEFYHIMKGLNLKITLKWKLIYLKNNFLKKLRRLK